MCRVQRAVHTMLYTIYYKLHAMYNKQIKSKHKICIIQYKTYNT